MYMGAWGLNEWALITVGGGGAGLGSQGRVGESHPPAIPLSLPLPTFPQW